MAVKDMYTNIANQKLKEKGEEFKVWTANSKDSDDLKLYVNENDLIQKEKGTFVVAGAHVSGI
ncbi:hypothetical protein CN277_11115 [Bacillus cereus]|uniref:hypothetical protein n=1 Tax=Bacillus cereus TaxID=1396 RepID=UPI000BED8BE1|nr:hypothetical protein [Bacillus cereus]PEE56856.1 hypothetical protein COM68_22240 [Bacillus cereus]PFC62509.1 hypothetical protein CN267_08585 [Bacillus cereus]PFD02793.1 hypothetical protein CN277_11115 [Bacillus cereus]